MARPRSDHRPVEYKGLEWIHFWHTAAGSTALGENEASGLQGHYHDNPVLQKLDHDISNEDCDFFSPGHSCVAPVLIGDMNAVDPQRGLRSALCADLK